MYVDNEFMIAIHQADEACKPLNLAIEKDKAVFRAVHALIDSSRLLRSRVSEIEERLLKLEQESKFKKHSLPIDVDFS